MARADPAAGVAVEILMEEQEVFPMRIVAEWRRVSMARSSAARIA